MQHLYDVQVMLNPNVAVVVRDLKFKKVGIINEIYFEMFLSMFTYVSYKSPGFFLNRSKSRYPLILKRPKSTYK